MKWLLKVSVLVHPADAAKKTPDVIQDFWIDPLRIAWIEPRDTASGPLANFVMDQSWPGAGNAVPVLMTLHSVAEALAMLGAR